MFNSIPFLSLFLAPNKATTIYIYTYIYIVNVSDKHIAKIINNQQDIKLKQFTQEELVVVLTKIKNRKAAGLDENTTRSIEDKVIRWPIYFYAVYNRTRLRDGQKAASSLPPKKGDLGIANKN